MFFSTRELCLESDCLSCEKKLDPYTSVSWSSIAQYLMVFDFLYMPYLEMIYTRIAGPVGLPGYDYINLLYS